MAPARCPQACQVRQRPHLPGTRAQLAVPVWICLEAGVRVHFIPFAEPWRNPVIEHFNDVFDKRFFRTERFSDLAHLRRRARAFERFHNSHHRYSVLKGASPDEHQKRLGFEARLLDPGFEPPTSLPHRGLINFVRLVRSNRELRILGSKIPCSARARASLCHCNSLCPDATPRHRVRGPSVARRAAVLLEMVTMTGTMWC